MANRDNIGLLYYIASRVKVVKGVFRPGETATQREEDESPEEEDDDLSEERKEAKAEERALEMAKAMEEHDIVRLALLWTLLAHSKSCLGNVEAVRARPNHHSQSSRGPTLAHGDVFGQGAHSFRHLPQLFQFRSRHQG